MATRFYFHAAANGLSGTFPSGENSSMTADVTATGANTLKSLTTSIGSLQDSISFSSNATTSTQKIFLGFFCTPALDAQTIPQFTTISVNMALSESNANMNIGGGATNSTMHFPCYIWRPSTGALITTLVDTTFFTNTEPSATNTEKVINGSGGTTVAGTTQAGDVIVVEVWASLQQGMGTSYTGIFYYDGTVENTVENTTVSDHASYIEFNYDFAFQGGAAFSPVDPFGTMGFFGL